MSIENTLKERGGKYGEFKDYAIISGMLSRTIENNAINNEQLEFLHLEALKMMVSKIARILNGDPNHIDNWHDIAGYATLVEKELLKNK